MPKSTWAATLTAARASIWLCVFSYDEITHKEVIAIKDWFTLLDVRNIFIQFLICKYFFTENIFHGTKMHDN